MERVLKELDAVRTAPDADAIHDLRVAIRRCRSIAAVMEEVDPDPSWPELRRLARKLFRQLGGGTLSAVEPCLLRHLFEAGAQQRISSDDDVQGLAEVVAEHPDDCGLKFLRDDSFRVLIQQAWCGVEIFNRSHVLPLVDAR